MAQVSAFALFCIFYVFRCSLQIDSSSFLIYNEDHNKCVFAHSASSMLMQTCDPSSEQQRFRWASNYRVLSLSLKLCLGAQSVKDWVKVLLFPCDETNELQRWECKNETLFGLRGQTLHLNYGNKNEKNLMIYKGSGGWSRWRIYGTKDDLCSRGYQAAGWPVVQATPGPCLEECPVCDLTSLWPYLKEAAADCGKNEVFTLQGNAFGAPCQFPFKFQEEWYGDCTTAGRSDGLLWCATETDYNKDQKWGFCPTKSTSGWDIDPVTGVFYQRNTQSALTWHQARKSCLQQGAELLSIVELHEQTYITGLTDSLGTSLWMGLNSLDFASGWQWSNGNPFRYLNWAPGQPSSEPGMNCATLNSAKASKWESSSCSKKLGYICRKGNSTSIKDIIKSDQPTFCVDHWVPYAGYCYLLQRNKMMWSEALAACRKEGGDLASMHNIEEHSFVISQLGYVPDDELWIGLNDERTQMLFEWSDRTHVTFTKWQTGEPSHSNNLQEDCVLMRGKEGKWADHMCEKEFGYICKKKASSRMPGTIQAVAPGCKPGWLRYASYCYHVSQETQTFDDARQKCQDIGSSLVDITSRYENAFLISLVGLRPEKYFWIGFTNMEDRNTFVWTNTKRVRFTHFNAGMPDKKQGCVAMTTGQFAGLWDVVTCSNKEKYICKHLAEGEAPTAPPTTALPLTCPSDWKSLRDRNYCYRVYKKNMKNKKTWFEARDYCRAIGGDLLSIHSNTDLERSMMYGSMSENAWIGLNALDPNAGFTWSDGSTSSYENWSYGEPNNYNDVELCAEVFLYYHSPWNDRHCESYNNWICQIRKGVTPKPPPADTQLEYNKTEDGWIEYNNSHYYINTQKLAMDDARAFCKKNLGELVVITTESERKFLWKQISRGEEEQYYIGLTVDLDKTFNWMDGTPVTYVAWEKNEPNFANNDENCVSIYKGMGYWNDINCGATLPSICKRDSSTAPNATAAPTLAPAGGCPPDWMLFQGKCYKFFGGKSDDHKPWKEARTYCQNLGGNLVSILNEKEQAFLTTKLLSTTAEMWIGLNDVNSEMRFLWTDGKGVYYTNWAKGHPVSVPSGQYMYDAEYDCVVMMGSTSSLAGLWKVDDCKGSRGYICKRNIDPQINPPATTVNPKTYYTIGSNSYKVVAQKMNWDEAQRQCKADDADLASVTDQISQAYISLWIYQHKEPLWLGLNSNLTGGYYRWIDNWRLGFTQWAPGEPTDSQSCVYINTESKWKTAPCSETHYALCKKSTEIAPTDPPQLPGSCPESKKRRTWVPFRGHCYAFISSSSENWAHASIDCVRMGGALISIEDPLESEFIKQNIEQLQDSSKAFWIGMYKNHDGDWLWIDNTVVDYTNWKTGEPSPQNEDCVQMYSDTAKWNNINCNRFMSYICKTPKIITPTAKAAPVVNHLAEAPHGNAGIAVAVVIMILVGVGLAGFFLYKRRQKPLLSESTFDNTLYFSPEPSRSTTIDTKGLVEHIEQNEQATI